jgi:hypothetical protein
MRHSDNKQIPPLAGICSYVEASKLGYEVEKTVHLIKRYNYVKSFLTKMFAAHIPGEPIWEVKGAFSHHMWLNAEHSTWLRKRVSEMREPPHKLDESPDAKLTQFMEEALRSQSSIERLTAIYGVIMPEMIRAIDKHLEEMNPLADYPTKRLLKLINSEEVEMLDWGTVALHALLSDEQSMRESGHWERHLLAYLNHAGGFSGDLFATADGLPPARWDGHSEYEMNPMPARDSRFVDSYNRSADIDRYYQESDRDINERRWALVHKRIREMDVPEYIAPMIYKVKGQKWEYYAELSRHLWDEARHSMMGETRIAIEGIPFYKYPIDVKTAYHLNSELSPREAHVFLFGIEQGLMPKERGKYWEMEICKTSGDPLMALYQDYDWADEVLHAQIGRKWLLPHYSSMDELLKHSKQLLEQYIESLATSENLSTQQPWWDQFLQEVQTTRA